MRQAIKGQPEEFPCTRERLAFSFFFIFISGEALHFSKKFFGHVKVKERKIRHRYEEHSNWRYGYSDWYYGWKFLKFIK